MRRTRRRKRKKRAKSRVVSILFFLVGVVCKCKYKCANLKERQNTPFNNEKKIPSIKLMFPNIVESNLLQIMSGKGSIASTGAQKHAGTKKPKGKAVLAKRHQKQGRSLADLEKGITNPAFKRLAQRAGIKRISGDLYVISRDIMKQFLENIIQDTVTYTDAAKKKTVTAPVVVRALQRHGRSLMGFTHK